MGIDMITQRHQDKCVVMPILAMLLFHLVVTPPPVLAEEPDWVGRLVGIRLNVAASQNQNDVLYKTDGIRTLKARIEGGLSSLLDSELFEITKTKYKDDGRRIEIDMVSSDLGKGRVVIYTWNEDDPPIAEEDVFWFIDLLRCDPSTPVICSIKGGGAAHYRGSNHCPEHTIEAYFDDLESATLAGLRPCQACFRPIILIEDYFEEMSIGRAVASHVLDISMPVQDDSLQAYVQSVGQDVLESWPLTLRGYDYRFTVIDMGYPNAVACPGGWIFISHQLIDICETRCELESVLAHEISHVEMRHGLQSLRKAKQSALIGGILGGLLGAAATSMKDDTAAQVGVSMAAVIIDTAMNIAFAGYNRRQEREADAFAVHYVTNRYGDDERTDYGRVLQKVEYVNDSLDNSHRSDPYATHPSTASRADFALNAEVEIFSPPLEFDFTRNGDLALQIGVTGVTFHSIDENQNQWTEANSNLSSEFGGGPQPTRSGSEMTLFTTVRTTNRLMVDMEIKDVQIRFGDRWVKLDNEEDPRVHPSQVTSIVFRTDRLAVGDHFSELRPDSVLVSLD